MKNLIYGTAILMMVLFAIWFYFRKKGNSENQKTNADANPNNKSTNVIEDNPEINTLIDTYFERYKSTREQEYLIKYLLKYALPIQENTDFGKEERISNLMKLGISYTDEVKYGYRHLAKIANSTAEENWILNLNSIFAKIELDAELSIIEQILNEFDEELSSEDKSDICNVKDTLLAKDIDLMY